MTRRTKRQTLSLRLAILSGAAAAACAYDPEARCDEHMELYGDGVKCVCSEGYAFTSSGCVQCRSHEVASNDGCVCADGFARNAEDRCERVQDTGQGASCEPGGSDCAGPIHDTCEAAGASGYCTSTGCTSSEDCEGGYACDTNSSPSLCRRPPTGLGQACDSSEDCADTDATYCETLMSHTCVVEGCSVEANDCFEGNECCDLTAFGLPTLCVPNGRCP